MSDGDQYPDATQIRRASDAVWRGWRLRAAELGRPEPADLGGACKFAALFAQSLFGGVICANFDHVWVEVDGRVLDLTALRADQIPDYNVDEAFMARTEFAESLESCRPRVERWAAEFRGDAT